MQIVWIGLGKKILPMSFFFYENIINQTENNNNNNNNNKEEEEDWDACQEVRVELNKINDKHR